MPRARPSSIVFLFLALCAAPATARAQADTLDAPDAEEYAVWSAVLRVLHGGEPGRLVIEGTTLAPRGPFRSNPDIEAIVGLPMETVDSLDARSRRAARVDHKRLRAGRARIVGQDEWEEGMPRIHLSRVGFDPSGTRAVVYVSMSCGMLCGSRVMVEARRDERGRWRFARFLTMSFS